MGLGSARAVRAALTDDGAADNERGFLLLVFGLAEGGINSINVVSVNGTDDIPAVGFKTLAGIVCKPPFDVAVNADAVVVVQSNKLVEPPDAGQRADFVANALHHAAVAQKDVSAVVNDVEAIAIEFGGKHLFGKRHAHGIGNALPQRARGRLHPRRDAHLGMSGRLAAQLTEVFDVVHRQVVARQMQHGVLQH